MLVESPGQSKRECKRLRRGGGVYVYVYVHGRVSRNTFGSRPWLKTELAWSQESETWSFCFPYQTRRDTPTDIAGLISVWFAHTHLHSWSHCIPTSFLYNDVVGLWLNKQGWYSCMKPQERTEWLLIPACIWEAAKQAVISLITHTHTHTHTHRLWERSTESLRFE